MPDQDDTQGPDIADDFADARKEHNDQMTQDQGLQDKQEESVEKEITRKGLIAPRVTPDTIDEAIDPNVPPAYHVFPGTTVTVCCITLVNGFNVVGESACASPENFDVALGASIAYDNAKQKIWALEGYALRNVLMQASDAQVIEYHGPLLDDVSGD